MRPRAISPDEPPNQLTDAETALYELEYRLIGWLLYDASCAALRVNECRSISALFLPVHRRIFAAISASVTEGGVHSVATIWLKLQHDTVLNEGGGFEYLRTCADSAPAIANERDGSRQFSATVRAYRMAREHGNLVSKANVAVEALKHGSDDALRLLSELGTKAREIEQCAQGRVRLSVGINEFAAETLPPQTKLLAPWLLSSGLVMVHAWRGVGKTHFGLGVAVACATGGEFLRWRAATPRRVLYVDGEMSAQEMQLRIRAALAGAGECPPDYFRLITPDMLPPGATVPNLQMSEGQYAIEADLEGRELVVLDNVATLFRTAEDQNSAGTWLAPQEYILSLRRRGIAVVVIDHDNKTGGNRGSSAKQDVLDAVIHLKLPSDYVSSEGARFEVHFEKHRKFYGRDAASFEAQLIEERGCSVWVTRDAEETEFSRFAEMFAAGMTERAIREELGIGGSKVSRYKKDFADRGAK